MCRQSDTADIELDVEPLSETIQEYPVRCAIRYGSHAHGTATGDSNSTSQSHSRGGSRRRNGSIAARTDTRSAEGTSYDAEFVSFDRELRENSAIDPVEM